jgi:sulfite exporter TauE/SafE
MEIYAGFLIGFLGSFHCVGMCGPIALALPTNSESQLSLLWNRILYNFGRIITYSLFGALFGLFGQRLSLVGLQEAASIILGAVILIAVLSPRKVKNWFASTPVYQAVNTFVKESFAKLSTSKSGKSFLWFGIINGFLPCGFVYVAIAGAVSTGGAINGAIFMALFGLGTLPIMLATSMAGKYLTQGIKRRINKLIPVFAVLLGIIFILRGLGLGIPYLSPKLKSPVVQTEMQCH